MGRIEGYRNFCNKLWNASKFVLMNLEGADLSAPAEKSLVDRWILSRARTMLEESERAFDTYRFDLLASVVYEFVWHEFCDWYVELTKPVLWDDDAPAKAAAQQTLLRVLETLLKAVHPIMPYITEELWQEVGKQTGQTRKTLMLEIYPQASDFTNDPESEAAVEWLKGVIEGVRNIRGEANIKPKQEIALVFQGGADSDKQLAEVNAALLKRLAKLSSISWLTADEEPPPHALQLVNNLRVMVPLAGLIDVAEERARLTKEIGKREQDLTRLNGKLSNEKFVANAPDDVVAKEKQKATEHTAALATLNAQLTQLDEL